MKTALVPIIKNKTGDTDHTVGDKNNYRPIALVTAPSKKKMKNENLGNVPYHP